jgi:hypothetical protein
MEYSCYSLIFANNAQNNVFWIHVHEYVDAICEGDENCIFAYLLTLPLFAGVSRVRALSPVWTGSHARETLISRTHLFLPHGLPPNKKIKYNKILTYILRSIFLEIPIWNSRADEKRREIRMVKVFKWYPVIDLICLTPLQVNWVMEIN